MAKLNKERVQALTETAAQIFAGNGTLRDVAKFTGVSHETIRQWLAKGRAGDERYAAFAAACDKALTVAKLRAWKKAEEKDPRWVLVVRHRVKDTPTKVELAGKDGEPIAVKHTHEMTADELLEKALKLHQSRAVEAGSESE